MRRTTQDTFLEKWAGPMPRATRRPDEAQRRAYAKAGIDPGKAKRRWS